MKPALIAAFLLFVAGCSAPNSSVPEADAPMAAMVPDPLVLGPHEVATALYDFGLIVATDPSLVVYRYPVQMTGNVHWPVDGDGPFPLILLMHGRHGTCAVLGIEGIGTHACPNAVVIEPVNSFEGYNGLATNLASHGYIVASVNANQINDRDLLGDSGANARAELALATIDSLAGVQDSGGFGLDALQGRIDLSRIGMMGHSRGGEGVARAVTLNQERAQPVALKAIFALAPTDFARWLVPDVAFATLLPYCDGDVSNLQGSWMYDDARRLEPAMPRHQILAMGANHNFYNTVWTGDDWGTAGEWCGSEVDGSGRDTPDDQRAHGDGLLAAFFRFYVGDELDFAPLWDGTAAWPASLCPAFASCDDRLYASHMPVRHQDLAKEGMFPEAIRGLTSSGCAPSDCPSQPTFAGAQMASWTCNLNGTATFTRQDLASWSALSLRVGGTNEDFRLWLEFMNPSGDNHVTEPAVFPARPGGDESGKTVLSEVRFSFDGVAGLDRVTGLLMHCAGDGQVQVADVMLV